MAVSSRSASPTSSLETSIVRMLLPITPGMIVETDEAPGHDGEPSSPPR
jgi:hypothetical protein